MRRLISPVLIGLGTFLLVVGVLVRFYAYPELAKVPANYESTTHLEATDATIFNSDPEVLAPETVDLAISSRTVAGDYPEAPEGVAVWANNVTVTPEGWDRPFQQSRELSPFDETTGAASSYDVGFEEVENDEGELEQVDVIRKGQVYKFPFDSQKKDYLQWDGTLGEATTAKYVGEDEIDGITVQKYVQTIEPTVVETRPVPGSIFGVDEPTVQADMVYEMTRTLYIEPATGSPINRVEERNQVLSYDGVEVPAFVATVQYTDKSIADIIDKVDTKAPLLNGTRLLIPLGLGLLGLLCIGIGFVLGRRQEAGKRDEQRQDDLVNA